MKNLLKIIVLSMLLLLGSSSIFAIAKMKLLDKTSAVFDDKIITLSSINRFHKTLDNRRHIGPLILQKEKYNNKDVIDSFINTLIIRAHLSEIGMIVDDDRVESDINKRVLGSGKSKKDIIADLKANGLTYDEFFEITRETLEYIYYYRRVIGPLVSVTEQEVKNYYYKQNADNKTLAFRYTLVDFYISKDKLKGNDVSRLKSVLTKFQTTGILPEKFNTVENILLGDITEEGLTAEVKSVLKNTDEGSFSTPIDMNNTYHVFFIKKKDLVQSSDFQKEKAGIENILKMQKAKQMQTVWMGNERKNHYIKYIN